MINVPSIKDELSLLKFALSENNVDPNSYLIGLRNEVLHPYEQWCLQEQPGGTWHVFYVERQSVRGLATFNEYDDAFNYFYWKLIKPQKPSFYRNRWGNSKK